MTPKDKSINISTEVVGQFNPNQQQEMIAYALKICDSLGWDQTDQIQLTNAANVVRDCILRGLRVQSRTWFGQNESLAQTFKSGLSQRQDIVSAFIP